MSKDETPAPGGLLSKMVKFVRNPTVNWSDLDALEADRDSQYSKQMLKEMIERKRRNDFVRKREFDQLRKLRQREAQGGGRLSDALVRASFFSSSMARPDERAGTLRKIDEIEAQMSQQWWKGKDSGHSSTQALAAGKAHEPQRPAVTPPAVVPPHPAAAPAEPPPHAFAPTAPMDMSFVRASASGPAPLMADVGRLAAVEATVAQASALDAKPFEHDPDLEEAAIRFASGDFAGAEAGLREVLAQQPQDDPRRHEVVLTLFDLYRATGQQDPFDMLAIDYAARFNRSAPLWFSLPEQLGLKASTGQAAPSGAQCEHSWIAPPTLTQQSVAALQASLARAASPWAFNWTRLSEIAPPAITALAQQFEDWADREVQLRFVGEQALQALLQAHTPSGDRGREPAWWRLRMAALRLMARHDEFELVALDYCVTYEVSPPAWVSPKCAYSGDDGAAPVPMLDGPDSDLFMSGFALSQPARPDDDPAASLQGQIDGDATPLLLPLEAMATPGAPLVVSCAHLIRIDFAAVGSVLNWAAEQQAQGRVVCFTQLHRLVAVLFNVIGINEHARISLRRD